MARDNFEQNEKERKKRWKGIVHEERVGGGQVKVRWGVGKGRVKVG